MGKKKSDASGGMAATLATTGAMMVLRKVLATVWTKVFGKAPPTDLTDPKVRLPEALAWAVATAIIVETARFAIARATMSRSAPESETVAS